MKHSTPGVGVLVSRYLAAGGSAAYTQTYATADRTLAAGYAAAPANGKRVAELMAKQVRYEFAKADNSTAELPLEEPDGGGGPGEPEDRSAPGSDQVG